MILQELNRKYFGLYAELTDAQPVLPAKQFEVMYKSLLNMYKQELEMTVHEWELAHGIELFKMRFDVSTMVPRRVLFWWNPVARRLLRRYKADFKAFLEGIASTAPSEQAPQQSVENACSSTALCEITNDVAPKA